MDAIARRHGLKLTAIGILAGLAGAFAATRLLTGAMLASFLLIFRASRGRHKEIDTIDHAYHGHINR